MDRISQQLVDYALAAPSPPRPGPVAGAALLHLVDTIACGLAGIDSEPGGIARAVARRIPVEGGASVFGLTARTTPDVAAFANTVMLRTYDWNDGMLAKGGGHPSDMIPAMLAVGETLGAPGARVLDAIVLSYEILGALGNAAANRDNGWDQGTFMGVATALGVGRLMGLDGARLGQAVALALVPAIPLRVTRTGALSMWKGCATAAAVRHAVFATELAAEGMTGPDRPFEGKQGLFDQVTGPFEVSLPAQPGGRAVVEMSHMKAFPAETHSQAFVGAAPALRAWVAGATIESILVETYWHAFHEIGSDPAKWAPETRETADHSLPYLLAVALEDGAVTLRSFTDERIARPSTRRLMQRIAVREDPAFTAAYRPPGATITGVPRSRITVRTTDGRERVEEVGYPRGHAENPMTREDVDRKLDTIAAGWLDPERVATIRAAWWSIDDAVDIGVPLRLLAEPGGPTV